MLNKAFGDSCMSKAQAYEWYKEFKAGREIVEDVLRSGRPSTSTTADNIDKIKTLVLENRHMSVREADSEPNFMKRTITGDETWVYEYDMQTSRQLSEWRYDDKPKPKKKKQNHAKVGRK
ncbi:hypothetical protein NQ318_016992 [Aromia moschata]|uniref:Mos1 transposase HTH domain-containing protein n=1 Tax=Aromia moschata TaxID=1265417 RepID=A0AAV8YCS4_9CUCU|nr:hypothetical protein NQ318_016992 [Aromia moschata]